MQSGCVLPRFSAGSDGCDGWWQRRLRRMLPSTAAMAVASDGWKGWSQGAGESPCDLVTVPRLPTVGRGSCKGLKTVSRLPTVGRDSRKGFSWLRVAPFKQCLPCRIVCRRRGRERRRACKSCHRRRGRKHRRAFNFFHKCDTDTTVSMPVRRVGRKVVSLFVRQPDGALAISGDSGCASAESRNMGVQRVAISVAVRRVGRKVVSPFVRQLEMALAISEPASQPRRPGSQPAS